MRRSYVRYSSIRNIPLSGLLRFQPHFWVPASPLNQVPAFSGSGYPKCTILRTKNYSSLYPELETPILCTLGTRFFRKWVPKMYHFTHKNRSSPYPEIETPILRTLGTRFFRKWVPKMYHFTHKKPFQSISGSYLQQIGEKPENAVSILIIIRRNITCIITGRKKQLIRFP